MVDLTLNEAQLFRMLSGFFGPDRVVPKMRVIAVCGGEIPQCGSCLESGLATQTAIEEWARVNRCLFTVVDHDDNPKMVIEFIDPIGRTVVVQEVEHRQFLQPILAAAGIAYVMISTAEFAAMTDPDGNLDLVSILGEHFGIAATE